jgi:hypothetical protein
MIETHVVAGRLDRLRAEIAAGERALHELDQRRDELVAGLIRLTGAVQALEEVLATAPRSETASIS